MPSPKSVSFEIADRLRQEILTGQYRVGERMPSERDLATRFEVSRGAVREALSQLEQQGVIEIMPGGARVQPLEKASIAVLGPLLALKDVPDPDLVDQFMEIFSMLTGLSVRGAIEQASADQMIQLQGMLVDLSHNAEDFIKMHPFWQSMLECMAGIDTNLVAKLIGNDVRAQVVEQMLKLDVRPKLPANSGSELVNALQTAFAERNGVMAAQAFEKHFDQLRQAIRDALEHLQRPYQRKFG